MLVCSWSIGIVFLALGLLVTLVLYAAAASNKAAADSENAHAAAADTKRALDTHEQVQAVQMQQIKDDLTTIKQDVKEIRDKLNGKSNLAAK